MPLFVTVVTHKVGVVLFAFAFARSLDGGFGSRIEGRPRRARATRFLANDASRDLSVSESVGCAACEDGGGQNLIRGWQSVEEYEAVLGVSDTHTGVLELDPRLIQLGKLRGHGGGLV